MAIYIDLLDGYHTGLLENPSIVADDFPKYVQCPWIFKGSTTVMARYQLISQYYKIL